MNKGESLKASIKLLPTLWKDYEGKWVAVADGELLDTSDKYKYLHDKFRQREHVIITRLVRPPAGIIW